MTSWISKFRTFKTYSIGFECLKLRNFNEKLWFAVSIGIIVKQKNSANHISQMENVWSSQDRIFVFNKNAFSVFLSNLDHCLLSTVLLS